MDTLERKYRKKPVVIEAVPVSNAIMAAKSNRGALPGWLTAAEADGVVSFGPDFIWVETTEGRMEGQLGDMLIVGVLGDIYPCKPDLFEATYDPVWTSLSTGGEAVVQQPSIGRVVTYRSRTGGYDVPAIVTATVASLAPGGVAAWKASDGEKGVPPLSSDSHVHLTVLTPGIPGQHAGADDFLVESEHGRGENVAGCYQEWDIPFMEPPLAEGLPDGVDPLEPGTWRWPTRTAA